MEVREPALRYSVNSVGFQETDVGLIPADWRYMRLTEVARLESGHTPSRRKPSYWAGEIPWVSLHDTESLGEIEITRTAQTISAEGLQNSSARLLPKGTVVFSRTATVGKASIMGREMATSQDFANYICGPDVYNRYLVYLFRHMAPEWKKLMAGSIHNTVYMPVFRALKIILPPRNEQQAIAETLSDADALIESLSQLLAKKRQIKQGAMQELLTGKKRLPGFDNAWTGIKLGSLGCTYGGLTGKTKADFGQGQARYITFMNVVANVELNPHQTESVDVGAGETQNSVSVGDLLFNGSSETPEEVALCSYVGNEVGPLFLNSFCFGFRPYDIGAFCGRFMAYFFRSESGRSVISALAQGATRYNISKTALLDVKLVVPEIDEQLAIVEVLTDFDADIAAVEARLAKARELKQGMMQALLTGRIRLVHPASNVVPLPTKPAATKPPSTQPAHNWQINEAVVIGVLAQRFGSEQFPLPRKRRVKLTYLLHRHAEGRAEGYLKKAAGPYDPNTKYKGPEQIALKNGYVRSLRNGTYEGFVAGDKIEQAQRYFEQWYGAATLEWLERFHYRKTDDLELLATVDMAMVDLAADGEPADVAGVKRLIAAHPEWLPKLSRELFSDERIAAAIAECQTLFGG